MAVARPIACAILAILAAAAAAAPITSSGVATQDDGSAAAPTEPDDGGAWDGPSASSAPEFLDFWDAVGAPYEKDERARGSSSCSSTANCPLGQYLLRGTYADRCAIVSAD